jgi:hypothetical protein
MQVHSKHKAIAISIFLLCFALTGLGAGQQPKSLVASATGEGTIKLGKEEFKIQAIVVKLFEDGKAEINLITDITVFVEGTWKRTSEDSKEIEIKLTGNATSNNMEGSGKLYLNDDFKSISGLKLQATNKTSKRVITAEFVAK